MRKIGAWHMVCRAHGKANVRHAAKKQSHDKVTGKVYNSSVLPPGDIMHDSECQACL